MSFPNFPGKQSGDAVLTPEALLEHRINELGTRLPDALPERIVLTYQPQLLSAVQTFESTTPLDVGGFAQTIHALDRTDGRVGVVGGFGIGAPAAVATFEELISYGCNVFMSIGASGALADDAAVGDLIVCNGAIRDEGVSHHYLPADDPARPDRGLTEQITERFAAAGLEASTGSTWTTDALFRETVDEVRHYAAQGVVAVDMEAAALFAVAAHRGVRLGAAFCVSDVLAGAVWQPSFNSDRLIGNMWQLFECSVAALESASH